MLFFLTLSFSSPGLAETGSIVLFHFPSSNLQDDIETSSDYRYAYTNLIPWFEKNRISHSYVSKPGFTLRTSGGEELRFTREKLACDVGSVILRPDGDFKILKGVYTDVDLMTEVKGFLGDPSTKNDPSRAKQYEKVATRDHIAYEKEIHDIDREYGFKGVANSIQKLEKDALGGDQKAFLRLVHFYSTSDGYISEGLMMSFSTIFENRAEFLLRNTYILNKDVRDGLYHDIIYNLYGGYLFKNTYPPLWEELKRMGEPARRFMKVYEFYREHPEHLEDTSIPIPE